MLIKVKEAKSIWGKTAGLIGKENPTPLLIRTRFGIHTFGVIFPIDVLVLNREQCVIYLKQDLGPNSFFFWNPLYDLVLELPSGMIKQMKIKKGSRIRFS